MERIILDNTADGFLNNNNKYTIRDILHEQHLFAKEKRYNILDNNLLNIETKAKILKQNKGGYIVLLIDYDIIAFMPFSLSHMNFNNLNSNSSISVYVRSIDNDNKKIIVERIVT